MKFHMVLVEKPSQNNLDTLKNWTSPEYLKTKDLDRNTAKNSLIMVILWIISLENIFTLEYSD